MYVHSVLMKWLFLSADFHGAAVADVGSEMYVFRTLCRRFHDLHDVVTCGITNTRKKFFLPKKKQMPRHPWPHPLSAQYHTQGHRVRHAFPIDMLGAP